MSEKHIEEAAFAIRAEFVRSVEESSGKSFAQTGVEVPDFSVWERYARAALSHSPVEQESGTPADPTLEGHVVTDAEVDAALKGWAEAIINAPDEGVDERRRRCIRAALEAALPAEGSAE